MIGNESEMNRLLSEGVISRKDYESMKALELEMSYQNIGYAFVTYAHSVSYRCHLMVWIQDQTKLALILSKFMIADGNEI